MINLLGVSAGGSPNTVSVPMSLLLGDTTQTGQVNSSDVSQAKSVSGNPIERDNFRIDVTVNGALNSSDISTIKAHSGTGLPAPTPAAPSAEKDAKAGR